MTTKTTRVCLLTGGPLQHGASIATCRVCGAQIDVAQARQDMRVKLTWQRYHRVRASARAESVIGCPIPPSTIRRWIQRGRLAEQPRAA